MHMDRNQKILSHLNLEGMGVEIGPSHRPIVPKKKGYNVHIIDHMNQADLIDKYRDHNIDLNQIEPVDFVWKGESYAELTGKKKYYDWIIASHLVEHTPDLIGFLNDCNAILKDSGALSLVIPDKRYCFDHFRPITGLPQIINSHFQKNTIHSAGTVAEYFLNVVSKGGKIAWDQTENGAYQFVHSLQDAKDGIKSVQEKDKYIDVHAWCFVPHSFRLMIYDLHALGLIGFQEMGFFPTTGGEFYITLSRHGQGPLLSRLEMVEKIHLEIGALTKHRSQEIATNEYKKLADEYVEINETLLNSTSWKLTAPMRYAVKKLKSAKTLLSRILGLY